MVVVKIGDGLGNQMYNYVCGYSVAKRDKDSLLLDTSEVDNSPFRTYGLDGFNIDYTDRESFGNRTVFHKIYKRLRRNLKYEVIFERTDESFFADMNVYKKRGRKDKYLHGYFQNLCYFNDCRKEILRQFTPREPLPEKVCILEEKFSGENICSLHIRGGDIPPLSIEYYKKAAAACKKECPAVRFAVFSNVRELAAEYMGQLSAEFGNIFSGIWEYGDFRDLDELFLMRACRFHILSDSTFSRWGALLDEKGGTVYAAYTPDEEKIYPSEWVKLRY